MNDHDTWQNLIMHTLKRLKTSNKQKVQKIKLHGKNRFYSRNKFTWFYSFDRILEFSHPTLLLIKGTRLAVSKHLVGISTSCGVIYFKGPFHFYFRVTRCLMFSWEGALMTSWSAVVVNQSCPRKHCAPGHTRGLRTHFKSTLSVDNGMV